MLVIARNDYSEGILKKWLPSLATFRQTGWRFTSRHPVSRTDWDQLVRNINLNIDDPDNFKYRSLDLDYRCPLA